MPVIEESYGAHTGIGRVVQDFGLCDLTGAFVYTPKLRQKGFLVVVFFSADAPVSVEALKAVQSWTAEVPAQKWTPVAVTEADREATRAFADKNGLSNLTFGLDYESYHARRWGVSNLPSTYLVSGKTGRVLEKAIGYTPAVFDQIKNRLKSEIDALLAAEEAARKADEAKKAADAAAKAEEAKKASAAPAKAS
jgi:peroxiredoxin